MKSERVGLKAATDFASEGDTLVIWKLDRLEQIGVSFVRITQNTDTGTLCGKLFFHIFGALAEYERELIRGTI